jgi:DNA-binding transcriptional LysR family regulator
MELTELRVFLRVAAERSFSRAAMKLHRTQPAVSQSVRRLEASVGERLFDRATKDATLTRRRACSPTRMATSCTTSSSGPS